MVVTRRTPVAPAPPVSRTASSQPIQRAVKGKTPQTTADATEPSSQLVNGETRADSQKHDSKSDHNDVDDSPSKKGKNKSKQKKGGKKRKDKSGGFLAFLERILIFSFVIYTLSVCPNDEALRSPICRGLSDYRRLVLDPYVIPAFQAALAHPSVAPYVDRAKPHVDRVVKAATPILVRTRTEWNARVVPQWNKRIVPQWNKRVVPEWNKRVVPEWNKHVLPQIRLVEKKIEPYLTRAELEYQRRIAPHVQLAAYNARVWRRKAQPYVILAASKTYRGYQTAKPYAIPLWQRIRAVVKQLLLAAQVQRRQFVDPHVARIWEKVKELSSGKPKTSTTFPSTPVTSRDDPLAPPAAEPDVSVGVHSVVASISETTSAVSSSATEEMPVATELEPQPLSPSPVAEPTAVADEATVTPTSSLLPDIPESHSFRSPSASPSAVDTLESASSVVSAASSGVASVTDAINSSILSLQKSVASTPSAKPVSVDDNIDIDLEAFYAELGLDHSLDTASETTEILAPPPLQTETEEEKAERKRLKDLETAEKRAGIAKRHKQWEDSLIALVREKKKELRKALVTLRKPAAAELKTHTEIRDQVEGLVAEAEKYLKGAEIYLKNLKKEGRKNEDKMTLWDRVVEKVEAKFEERLTETEGIVNGWYKVIHDRELEEVWKAANEVKDLASKAQADIGMDYAWLDDVTYEDWQRYHDLMTRSENFTDQALSIQNGTHPSPPVNPVLRGIDDLDSEVQDIVMGFETRLRGIKRSGERAFGATHAEDVDDEDASPEPEVSILPVPAEDSKTTADESIPPVIIGRSEAEVLEALGKVETRDETKVSEPETSKNEPEEMVESLVREAEVEADLPSSPSGMPHEEL